MYAEAHNVCVTEAKDGLTYVPCVSESITGRSVIKELSRAH